MRTRRVLPEPQSIRLKSEAHQTPICIPGMFKKGRDPLNIDPTDFPRRINRTDVSTGSSYSVLYDRFRIAYFMPYPYYCHPWLQHKRVTRRLLHKHASVLRGVVCTLAVTGTGGP
eukprot:509804-Prorocentrum_minimum.AAC.1